MDEELFDHSLHRESNEWTKDTLSGLGTCKGVLLFTHADGQPIQLLQAASIRRTAQAKLLGATEEETASPSRKTDISELTARIDSTCCYNNFQSQITYIRLAHAIFGAQARDWIQLPSPVFSAIETDATLPYFTVSSNSKTSQTRHVFGLFPNRKAAARFCEILNTVFGLCRNPSLVGTGSEASCPYLQMQTCPGSCVGKLKAETYRAFVSDALAVAGGDIDSALAEKTRQMQTAAQSMHYERAKVLKDQIEALTKLKGPAFKWTSHLNQLAVLHIDRAGKIKVEGQRKLVQQYAVWKITATETCRLGQCSLEEPEPLEALLGEHRHTQKPEAYAASQYEHLATLSLFLFRNNVQGFWGNVANGLPETATLHRQLLKVFNIEMNKPT